MIFEDDFVGVGGYDGFTSGEAETLSSEEKECVLLKVMNDPMPRQISASSSRVVPSVKRSNAVMQGASSLLIKQNL